MDDLNKYCNKIFLILGDDAERRLKILKNECSHFVNYLNFIKGENSEHSRTTSTMNFLSRLLTAAECLKDDSKYELDEINRVSAYALSANNKIMDKRLSNYAWLALNSKWRSKSTIIAERLGELHERLEQYLAHTNLDQHISYFRRRSEMGQLDRYLMEHCRWVHRDIINSAIALRANYPYENVPSTFFTWHYGFSSRIHSFQNIKGYNEARNNIKDILEKDMPFVTLCLRYWTPERIVTHPIIGHELAHVVLDEIFGLVPTKSETLNANGSELAHILRSIQITVQNWNEPREYESEYNGDTHSVWYLTREIMCDLLAVMRYKHAYLYAWILETAELETVTELFKSEHDYIRRVNCSEPGQNDSKSSELHIFKEENLKRDIIVPARMLALRDPQMVLNIYRRGIVICGVLKKLPVSNKSANETELVTEVEAWLDCLLRLSTGMDADVVNAVSLYDYEKTYAEDLINSIDLREFFSSNSSLIKSFKQTWDNVEAFKNNKLLHFQVVGKKIESVLVGSVLTSGRENTKLYASDTLNDWAWRREWESAAKDFYLKGNKNDVQYNDKKQEIRKYKYLTNYVNKILIDNYLLRTGSPLRFLQTVYAEYFDMNSAPNKSASTINPQKYYSLITNEWIKKPDDF